MDNLKYLKLPYKSIFSIPELKMGAVSYLWPQNGNKDIKKVLIFYPGNPGIPEYYIDFLDQIYNNLNRCLEIILIGHVGHSSSQSLNLVSESIYSLNDQVEFKLHCLDKIVESYPKDTDYFFMSHSMGGWLTEQVLKQRPDYNIKHIINLFPALCDIRNTPNGIKMCSFLFLKYPMMIAMWIIFLFSLLPRWLKFYITKIYTRQNDRNTAITIDNLLLHKNAQNSLNMGFQEMTQISDLNEEFYIKNENKLTIYYGENDGWSPKQHYVNMKKLIPNANIHFCDQKLPHAFVLDHSPIMAEKVTKWLVELV